MKLKPINWVTDHLEYSDYYVAVVMGITLAVIPDEDGTFTASLSGVPYQRPELQKGLSNTTSAKEYAEQVLLKRELNKHFMKDEPNGTS